MTEEDIWIVPNSILNTLPTTPQANIQKKEYLPLGTFFSSVFNINKHQLNIINLN